VKLECYQIICIDHVSAKHFAERPTLLIIEPGSSAGTGRFPLGLVYEFFQQVILHLLGGSPRVIRSQGIFVRY
jgi:hypothetical protein